MWNRNLNYLAKYMVFWEVRIMMTFYNKVLKKKYTYLFPSLFADIEAKI